MSGVNLKDVLGISTSRYVVVDNGDVYSYYSSGEVKKLKPTVLNRGKGYAYVTISDNGVTRKYYVHQLVAKAFINNPYSKTEVNHKDCNTLNNCVSNLEWVNHSENIKHAWSSGMMNHRVLKPLSGEEHSSSKLTNSQVKQIRLVYLNSKTSYRKIAKEYGVSNTTIQSIIERKSWKHI